MKTFDSRYSQYLIFGETRKQKIRPTLPFKFNLPKSHYLEIQPVTK